MTVLGKRPGEDVPNRINRYSSYFNKQINAIDAMKSSKDRDSSIMYRKSLYVCLLSALACGRYGKQQGKDRQHFLQLISDYSDWAERDRVSTVQLHYTLTKNKTLRAETPKSIMVLAGEKVREMQSGNVYPVPAVDDEIDFYSNLISSTSPKVKNLIFGSRMQALLYDYRCHLVHEFRSPGYGIEMTGDGERAYYHSYINRKPGWELVFPLGLFKQICKSCVENLHRYYLAEGINPYGRYRFSSLWSDKFKT